MANDLAEQLGISDKRNKEIAEQILYSSLANGTFSKAFRDINKKLKLTVNEAAYVGQGIEKLNNIFKEIGGLV